MTNLKTIKILGEEINSDNFPAIYQWAKVNQAGLENTIKKMQTVDNSSVSTILITLETEFRNDNS